MRNATDKVAEKIKTNNLYTVTCFRKTCFFLRWCGKI